MTAADPESLLADDEMHHACTILAHAAEAMCRRDGGRVLVTDVMRVLVFATAQAAMTQCEKIGATHREFSTFCPAVVKALEDQMAMVAADYRQDEDTDG